MNKNETFVATQTVAQLKEIIAEAMRETLRGEATPVTYTPAPTPKHVHGLAGIASLFGCSIPTAYRIKKSGVIDAAITQVGRKIVVDAPKALELAGKPKGGRK